MSVKKRCVLFVAAALALALVFVIPSALYTLSWLDSGIPAEEYSAEIEALQFGDIPETGTVAVGAKYNGAVLSRGSFASAKTVSLEEQAYEILVSGLLAEETKISFSGMGITQDQLRSVFTDALNSNPSLFYVNGSYRIGSYDTEAIEYVLPSYKASGEELAGMRAEYEELVLEILAEIEPSWSDFEKVLFVHDYTVKNFEYDYSYSVYDAYNFLKNKKGVCQAYTLLCIELLNRLDINVGSVPSVSMNHIWNCVELDGKWYHMDITWSDASASGNLDRFDEISYENFLCGDSAISATGHSGWTSELVFSDDYDSLFLKTVGSRIDVSPLGDDWYVLLKGDDGNEFGISLSLADFENNTYTEKARIKTQWHVWDLPSSYYTDVFAGFGRYHDALVISTHDTLYAYNPEMGIVELGKYTYSDGYICGMKISFGRAIFRVTDNPVAYEGNSYPEINLSDIVFALEISYDDKTGESVAETYTTLVGWGKEFSVDSPSVSGYTAEPLLLSGKMSLGGIKETVVYKAYRTLKIDYVYENGSLAYESYVDTNVEIGASYSVSAPVIAGYYPSVEKIEGSMTDVGVTATVIYYNSFYNIEIDYVYEDGSPAGESYTASGLAYMTPYSVTSPVITGFTPSIGTVSGSITENIDVTVVYTVIRCKITVKYLYPDGSLIEEKEIIADWGSDFEIASPSIKGYTAENTYVSGKIEQENAEFTVSYTANKYPLRIEYLYADGTLAGENYVGEIEYGAQYDVPSPSVAHYTPSLLSVSGIMTDSGVNMTVVYTVNKYKIEFVSEGEIFFSAELEYGSEIILPDEIPQKASTAQKNYTFKAWSGYEESMTASENITFVAEFDESLRKYIVTFKNYDGALLYETEVEYGNTAVYAGETPVHPSIGEKTYIFVGWDEDTDSIISDTVFTAVFSDGVTVYTVSFYDEDGRLLKTEQVYHGYNATPPKNPVKASDNIYNYAFNGWIGKYKRVTSDSEVRASYRAEYIEYKIVFKNHDGSIISEQKLHFGDNISLPEAPIRESDEIYDYTFEAWLPEVAMQVEGNAEYTAIFTKKYKFEFTPEEFVGAFDEIARAYTLDERFDAIMRVISMKERVYLGDPSVVQTLEKLDAEIEKYNSEIAEINLGFTKASETVLSFDRFEAVCLSTFVLLWALLKKLLGIG